MHLRIRKFNQLSFFEKKLFFEAYWILIKMRLMMLLFSFKFLTKELECSKSEKTISTLTKQEINLVYQIKKSILRASRYTPWKSTCLVQALTAYQLLKRYKLSGLFFIGVSREKREKAHIKAHAWSQCGNMIVTGGLGHQNFIVISVFGWSV